MVGRGGALSVPCPPLATAWQPVHHCCVRRWPAALSPAAQAGAVAARRISTGTSSDRLVSPKDRFGSQRQDIDHNRIEVVLFKGLLSHGIMRARDDLPQIILCVPRVACDLHETRRGEPD